MATVDSVDLLDPGRQRRESSAAFLTRPRGREASMNPKSLRKSAALIGNDLGCTTASGALGARELEHGQDDGDNMKMMGHSRR